MRCKVCCTAVLDDALWGWTDLAKELGGRSAAFQRAVLELVKEDLTAFLESAAWSVELIEEEAAKQEKNMLAAIAVECRELAEALSQASAELRMRHLSLALCFSEAARAVTRIAGQLEAAKGLYNDPPRD